MSNWVDDELETLDLGDERRERRIKQMVARMAERPGASVPQTFEAHAETMAAYRALGSEATDPEAILAAAQEACLGRVREERLVLAIQDTTELNFSGHPGTTGMGRLKGRDDRARGCLVHTVLAVSEDGVPLGRWWQKLWTRDPESASTRDDWQRRPFDAKESFRWVEGLRAVHATKPPGTTVVTVADREADVYEVFAEPRPAGSELLIRGCYDRKLRDEEQHLWAVVESQPVAGRVPFLLPRTRARLPRPATLEVRFAAVTLHPPRWRPGGVKLPAVSLTAVWVTEASAPPGDEKPVRWLLLTTLPVTDFADAQTVIRYYTYRWLIERYHYILKSGCRLEDTQLRTLERITRLLALYCLVAGRLLWMTYSARVDGDQPCTVAFTDPEWQTAFRYHHGTAPLPEQPPPLRQVVRWVARLGGFLARKSDGEPGAKVLWRGLTRLQDIVLGVLLVQQPDLYNG
jgi:hypothetical protein